MIRWPDRLQVDAAVRAWAGTTASVNPRVRRIGYFGSYARGDWGVGSDLDLVLIVSDDPALPPFESRGTAWDVSGLPVPAELLVYTESEWDRVLARRDRFARMLEREVVWIHRVD